MVIAEGAGGGGIVAEASIGIEGDGAFGDGFELAFDLREGGLAEGVDFLECGGVFHDEGFVLRHHIQHDSSHTQFFLDFKPECFAGDIGGGGVIYVIV